MTGKLEQPTVVERAVAVDAELDARARAERLAKELETAQPADPAIAATFHHELGEVTEHRLGNEVGAVRPYRRALELDPQFQPARWAVRRLFWRRAQWAEYTAQLDAEIRDAPDDVTRADLVLERVVVPNAFGVVPSLDGALRAAPDHRGVLLELERQVAGKRVALLDVLERLAQTLDHPEHQIAYWLEVSRCAAELDVDRARAAVANASRIARTLTTEHPVTERVARERLRIAEEHGLVDDTRQALAELAGLIALETARSDAPPHHKVVRRRELVAIHRRQAQLAAPGEDARKFLLQALALAPSEPLLLVDLVELAHEQGQHDEMARLVHAWFVSEEGRGRAAMMSWWCARAQRDPEQRRQLQPLLGALATEAPEFLLWTSLAEADALRAIGERPDELARAYLTAARAARLGSWTGPALPAQPQPQAAVALYIQAAELLAYQIATPDAIEQARGALVEAAQIAPSHPAVVEAVIELDDVTGRGIDALARLRDLAAAHNDRASVERALRTAYAHEITDDVLQLQRYLIMLEPDDRTLTWQLESTLYQLGRDGERADVLGELARNDPDPERRRTALLGACRLHEQAGAHDVAIELYREAAAAGDRFAQDALVDLLRAREKWPQLAAVRVAELRDSTPTPTTARRALRELGWIYETKLADTARAAEVYADWSTRLPGDRTALEGLARCSAKLADHARETATRAAIVEIDGSAESRWLYARSLERAGLVADAIAVYRALGDGDNAAIATLGAAAALGMLVATMSLPERAEAAAAWASRTSDPNLGVTLFEESAWIQTVAVADFERAAAGFAAALELDPQHHGAWFGAALVAACRGDRERLGAATAELAALVQPPEVASALFLRAAACAAADGNTNLANDRIKAARTAAPDSLTALLVASEAPLGHHDSESEDPFAAVDELVARAEVYAKRAALADEPATRAAWELDRAEALELASQLSEASLIVGEVLTQNPSDRRAASMLRRIAYAAGDTRTWAYASYGLALLTRDPALRLRLLRDVITVFEQPRLATTHAHHVFAAYRQIAETDPGAPEVERLLDMLRDKNEITDLVITLSSRLDWLLRTFPEDERSCFPLLFERARLLDGLKLRTKAAADLDALLARAPEHIEALLLRADIARTLGDVTTATARLNKCLEVETNPKRRGEIERRLAELVTENTRTENTRTENATLRAPPALAVGDTTAARIVEDTTYTWQSEVTDPEQLNGPPPLEVRDRRTTGTHVVRKGPPPPPKPKGKGDPLGGATVVADPFGASTALADMSALAEGERRQARITTPPPFSETAVVENNTTRASRITTPPPIGDSTTDLPAPFKDSAPTIDEGTGIGEAPLPPRPEPKPASRPRLKLPAIELAELLADATGATRSEPTLDLNVEFSVDPLADDSAAVILSYEQLKPQQLDASEEILDEYEREISLQTDSDALFMLRIEAGRLSEAAGEPERARAHYDAALLVRPKAPMALRGLRRLACAEGELLEAAQLIEAELAAAGEREREPLLQHRINLLLAIGEQDLARVAVGELLDRAPDDVPGLLANLQLALIDRRPEELGATLERLATTLNPELRRSVCHARAVLAAHVGDPAAEATWVASANAADPSSLGARLAAAVREGDAGGVALFDLACHIEKDDPAMAAAFAVRAQSCSAIGIEDRVGAAQLAVRAAPRDPLVARFAAETALAANDTAGATNALARWARGKGAAVERAYAAALAAELDPTRLGRLWSQALELDPDCDYISDRLRSHLATDGFEAAVEVDLRVARETERAPRLLRAAAELMAEGERDRAIEVLQTAHAQWSDNVAVTEALAAALAKTERWGDRAALLAELAASPGPYAADIVRLRSAHAATKAARAMVGKPREEEEKAIVAALGAWDLVLDAAPQIAIGHAAAISLAQRLGDADLLAETLRRLRVVEQLPWSAASLALRQARLVLQKDPRLAQELARDVYADVEDPRCTLMLVVGAARRGELAEAANALADRAARLALLPEPGLEPAMLRARAAQLALDANNLLHAKAMLAGVDAAIPGLVDDLVDVAAERSGEPAMSVRTRPQTLARASFARVIRDADRAEARGDAKLALELYEHALERWFADPIAAAPLFRLSIEHGEPAKLRAIALERLRTANARDDAAAKADAYELLARVEPETSHVALERALQADPSRLDVLVRVEREHGAHGRFQELLRLRARRLEAIRPSSSTRDLVAMLLDTASVATRAKAPDSELAVVYRAALDLDPKCRVAMYHLEAILRQSPASPELVRLEDHLADHFEDPRARAAALTRAGEALLALGNVGEAVARFARATELVPTYAAALDAWYQTALSHELWGELAEAVTRKAALATTPDAIAARHHYAGVALMDKARVPERAIASLRKAIEAKPGHLDAFLRLRMLFGITGDRDARAATIRARLEIETDRSAQIELNRMLAEHFRNVGDRESAVRHYRAMLAIDPADARAHAAIADAASDPSNWRDAADAVRARLVLERDVMVLHDLDIRLGNLAAEHDPALALQAFQRVLTCDPDDDVTRARIVDLAIAAADWQVALDACDRLVKTERAPDKLAGYLSRAATVFARGLGDNARAERMLVLALESAPTSTQILTQLLELHEQMQDPAALRAHLDRIVELMRARIAAEPKDAGAYCMLARALAAREAPGDRARARSAGELARLLGATVELEDATEAPANVPDDKLFTPATESMRALLRVVAEPLAKHAGVDLGTYGVGRKDRLRATDPTAIVVHEVAGLFGLDAVDTYIAHAHPHAAVALPTHPPSLVLGTALVASPAALRFGAGAALKLAQLALAIPACMRADELGVVGLAILKLIQPDLVIAGIDDAAAAKQVAKLRRQIPAKMLQELRPLASTITAFDPHALARELKIGGLRAGFAVSRTVLPGVAMVAAAVGTDLPDALGNPITQGLVTFAVGNL